MKCILAVLVVAILAKQSWTCDAPANWEGHVTFFDSDKHEEIRSRIYYDATNTRVRVNELIFTPPHNEEVEERFYMHKEDKLYIYDPKTKECHSETLGAFKPIGVPTGAKFITNDWVGLEPKASAPATDGLEVQVHSVESTENPGENYIAVYTINGCIPVYDVMRMQKNGKIDIHKTSFFNITTPIVNPETVFMVPEPCKS